MASRERAVRSGPMANGCSSLRHGGRRLPTGDSGHVLPASSLLALASRLRLLWIRAGVSADQSTATIMIDGSIAGEALRRAVCCRSLAALRRAGTSGFDAVIARERAEKDPRRLLTPARSTLIGDLDRPGRAPRLRARRRAQVNAGSDSLMRTGWQVRLPMSLTTRRAGAARADDVPPPSLRRRGVADIPATLTVIVPGVTVAGRGLSVAFREAQAAA